MLAVPGGARRRIERSRVKPSVRVAIITRFSILIEKHVHSWKLLRNPLDPRSWLRPRNPSLAEKTAYLFAPARLEARFRRFEALLLPSIAAQTRPAEHIVLSSTLLPAPYRDRLEALSRRFGFRLHFAGTDRLVDRILVQDGLLAKTGAGRLATVRVDDDDAIATTFVARVERFAHLDVDDYVLSFPKGVYLDQRRSPSLYAPVVQSNIACGLTRVLRRRGRTLSVYAVGNHNFVHHALPVLQIPDPDMYLMTTHADNVSHRLLLRRLPGGKPLTPEAAARLGQRFGVDLAEA